MAAIQFPVAGFQPVYLNSTATRQESTAAPVYVNETVSTTTVATNATVVVMG